MDNVWSMMSWCKHYASSLMHSTENQTVFLGRFHLSTSHLFTCHLRSFMLMFSKMILVDMLIYVNNDCSIEEDKEVTRKQRKGNKEGKQYEPFSSVLLFRKLGCIWFIKKWRNEWPKYLFRDLFKIVVVRNKDDA